MMLHVEGAPPMQIGDREWAVLRQADGTRDLEGIRLAAEQAGARVRAEHLQAFLEQLAQLGAFERSEPSTGQAFARDLPIAALPDYRFACDGAGGCCSHFDTVLFAPVEVARARARLPLLEDAGAHPERVFLPESGSSSPLSVVTRREGGCLYLDPQGRCRIHEDKPAGCRVFPARFVDVGDAIRVTPRTECACVFEPRPGGGPLTEARRGGELPREVFVPVLPETIRMGGVPAPRDAVVRFFDARRAELDAEPDLAAYAWSLADALEGRPREPDFAPARASIARLKAHLGWRAGSDIVRRSVEAVDAALLDLSRRPPVQPADERLYLRAAFFAILGVDSSVEAELRERALVLWIARAFSDPVRRHFRHPLAVVEALVRGHGFDVGAAGGTIEAP